MHRKPVTVRHFVIDMTKSLFVQSNHNFSIFCFLCTSVSSVCNFVPFQLFREARRTSPCVVYLPHFGALWNATGDSLHATLLSLLQDLPPLAPVLFLATADETWNCLPHIMQEFFSVEIGQVSLINDMVIIFSSLMLSVGLVYFT